ncbi:MAG: hypothetical protein LBT88_03245 [Oscillospiraceae bacterium]|jgi:hypothetical protein|nr:hypothetical protein [Oscillospiraceae bacterium]
MKKSAVIVIALMITLLLSACAGGGKNEHQAMLNIRQYYLKTQSLTLSVDLTADYGGRVYKYLLTYSGDDKRGELSVSEPDNISGISASIEDTGVTLRYDGALIDTGELTANGISPLMALPLTINAWREGYIMNAWREMYIETESIASEIRLDDGGLLLKTWFDADTYAPLRAELYADSFCVMGMDFNQ